MLPTPEPSRGVAPTIGRAFAFIVMLYVCAAAAQTVIPPVVREVYALTGFSIRGDFIGTLVAALAATAIMVRSIDQRSWESVGLHRGAINTRALVSGALIGGGAVSIACALVYGAGMLQFHAISDALSWTGTAAYATSMLLIAALGEEVACRGYLLTVLKECTGARVAVILTSMTFALLHLNNPDVGWLPLVVVALSGVMLAWIRIAFDSLYAAWMAHVAWNWIMVVPLHAAVSGYRFEETHYQAITTGPVWFSGGSWGPEGGVAALMGIGCALWYLNKRHRRQESWHD